MIPVVVESPYGAPTPEGVAENVAYLRRCLRDSLLRGEAPIASHGLYTQEGVLEDGNPEERRLGMQAGFAWRHAAARTVVYVDRGVSPGMQEGIRHAQRIGGRVEYRRLDPPWSSDDETPRGVVRLSLNSKVRARIAPEGVRFLRRRAIPLGRELRGDPPTVETEFWNLMASFEDFARHAPSTRGSPFVDDQIEILAPGSP